MSTQYSGMNRDQPEAAISPMVMGGIAVVVLLIMLAGYMIWKSMRGAPSIDSTTLAAHVKAKKSNPNLN